ncbi:hydroxyneurosporene synthase [Rhizobium sp. Root274]|uniref:hydroxyneurosporene synthase n=1 Tax=unclassified Rhizobium TaxID=2613769 RepID=UPI0007130AC9|nr:MULTISPECIES: hydroxyneurosporene synthase [unclassified Rhizobium]KQW29613.1 hydroxyneurosporene synthase [Rhizobium sp. Root1240]KRD29805.1 hydroxyneurosporene synthase [Rhizobium sp. Root274]
MIAFVGSVFSPYYHWSGRTEPENHVAFNVALYGPDGHAWAMTERSRAAVTRSTSHLEIGRSSLSLEGGALRISFDEVFLPWPGQRLWPKRMRGEMVLTPRFLPAHVFRLDEDGRHHWSPIMPSARVEVTGDAFVDGGWSGEGYHDTNWGDRPLEQNFVGWDWARGAAADGGAVLIYDALAVGGGERRLGLRFSHEGDLHEFELPRRQTLPRGFWGVGGGIAAADGSPARFVRRLEDSPFYRRSLVETALDGERILMMHETLDCRRLSMPLVRLMLPFRMPRRG